MSTHYLLSAHMPEQLISDSRAQIVFAGRSNVGKSSVINTLTGQKGLARVAKAPGKTRAINYYAFDERTLFVDLPGYGYAKVSAGMKDAWGELIEHYFTRFDVITRGVLVIDARHDPSADDINMARFFQSTCIPWMVLCNKCDKLKEKDVETARKNIAEILITDPSVPVIAFSAETRLGKNAALAAMLGRP